MPTVTIIGGSGTGGASGGHSGEWRGSAKSQWCSLSTSREGASKMYREASGSMLFSVLCLPDHSCHLVCLPREELVSQRHLHNFPRLWPVAGVLCTHGSEVLRHEHWSCCGATSQSAPCSATCRSSGGVDISNPRSWCKRGAWASRDGKIGKVTMDPDSDSEVKLVWADGETSGYIKIDRLQHVGEGRHSSHGHTLAPCERRGWNCDVW
jgi:hypothetical protein